MLIENFFLMGTKFWWFLSDMCFAISMDKGNLGLFGTKSSGTLKPDELSSSQSRQK